jgi:hypothetical protein
METISPAPSSTAPLPDPAKQRERSNALYMQGRYQEALDVCLQTAQAHPNTALAWIDAAINCAKLLRWPEAVRYGEAALACGGHTLGLCDLLAQAYCEVGQWDKARTYGLQAFELRERQFGGPPVIAPPEPEPMPPLPSAQTRERNIIAFSLFGREAKYCETAVLNVQDQPGIYPHWVCRFYVDDSVPANVIDRIRAGGGQVVLVEGPAAQWPGPMWRLLALNDPLAHRILFRDADSLISRREAHAVDQWLTSGKRFHMMRDWGSHGELMLAGLWGVVAGSLPPLDELMALFLRVPIHDRHFVDQYFLRQYVWPYARTSLMQHDSVFGFMGGVPFPDGARPPGFHVGGSEGSGSFVAKANLPDGLEVTWALYLIDDGPSQEKLICSYPGVMKNGTVTAHVPGRYAQWINQRKVRIRLFVSKTAQPESTQ